jgi:hypothetical protein
MATSNVWLRDLNDRLVCADQVTGMYVDRVPGLGWTVIVSTRQYGDVALADFGRGGRARTGADHLLTRLPGVIAAASQDPAPAGYQITYTPGLMKGAGDWSTTRETDQADATPLVNRTRGPSPAAQRPRPAPKPPPSAPRHPKPGSSFTWPDPLDRQ